MSNPAKSGLTSEGPYRAEPFGAAAAATNAVVYREERFAGPAHALAEAISAEFERAAPERRDRRGRVIRGNHVHKDFHPVPWLLAAGAILGLAFFLPTLVTIVAVLIFAGLLMRDVAALRPPDYDL